MPEDYDENEGDEAGVTLPPGDGGDGGNGLTLPGLVLQGPDIEAALALPCMGLGEIENGKWGIQTHGACKTVSALGIETTRIETEPSGAIITLPAPLWPGAQWTRLIRYDDHKDRPDMLTGSGVLKPWMLSLMLNTLAVTYNTFPPDSFCYQDPVSKTTVIWWIEWVRRKGDMPYDNLYARLHYSAGGVFDVSGEEIPAVSGGGELGFSDITALADAEIKVVDYIGFEAGEREDEWFIINGGIYGMVTGQVFRLVDHTPNGKKALFGLARDHAWNNMLFALVEFTATGSVTDGSFTVTPHVALTPAECVGPCEYTKILSAAGTEQAPARGVYKFYCKSAYGAWYDESENIVPLYITREFDHDATRWDIADTIGDLAFAETYTISAGAASQQSTSNVFLSIRRPQGSNTYTAQARLSFNGTLIIDETDSIDAGDYLFNERGWSYYIVRSIPAAVHALFSQKGNANGQAVTVSNLLRREPWAGKCFATTYHYITLC
jgi:hypothetical protein